MRAAGPRYSGLTVARWCVYLIAGLVPVAASYYPGFSDTALPLTYDQYVVVKFALVLALAGVGLGAWLVHAATEGVTLRRVPALEYVVGALLLWASVSALLSVHRPTAVLGAYARYEGLLSFVVYAAVAFLALQVLDSPKRLREWASIFVASGSLVAVYGLLQSFGVMTAPEGTLPFEAERAFATYGNPNMLGVFLLMPAVLSLGLALTEDDRRLRALFWLAFSLCAAALLLTFTRAAWLAIAVGLVALGVAAWRLRVKLDLVDYVFAAGAALALVALGVRSAVQGVGVTDIVQRFAALFDLASGSVGERIAVWSGVIDTVVERPVMGFGPDTLMLVWGPHVGAAAAGVVGAGGVDSAHSLPLHLAAGIGVIGATLYLAAFVMALGQGAKAVRTQGHDSRAFLCVGYVVALGTALLASLVSVTDAGLSVLMWMLAAAAATVGARASSAKLRLPRMTIAAALLVAAVGLTAGGVLISADHAMARARIEAGTDTGFQWAERAVVRNPFNDEYRLELGLQHFDRFAALVEGGDVARAAEHFSAAETVFSELVVRNPWYTEGHLALAELYVWGARALDGRHALSALDAAERARELAPGSPRAIGAVAVALATQGRVAEAEAELRAALEVMPDDAQLQELLQLVTGGGTP